jgi:glucosylglycerate synthase
MVELSGNPDDTKERAAQIGPVDLVIGFADSKAGENLPHTLELIRTGLGALADPQRAVVLYKGGFEGRAASNGVGQSSSLRLLPYTAPEVDPSLSFAQSISADYRAMASASDKLEAKAYVLIASDLETVTPQWIFDLAHPLTEHAFDFVSPCYVFHKFEGILNNAILYPLIRSLYGKRIQNPLGPDMGMSSKLLRQVLRSDSSKPQQGITPRITIPIGAEAASRALPVCQANLGERKYPPIDWKNLSSLLAEVLGPLFQTMERDAPIWQRVRGSEPVHTVGPSLSYVEDPVAVDVRRLLEPFQLGFRNLQEIWGLVLPPKTLFELQKLGRAPAENFQMPDDVWVRIIYDFSLGYRLRAISRDHLLRALTPLYLGWVASYALEVEKMSAPAVQYRIDRLCEAYEAAKPYLVSRWRWPDRFNP